tara:strand:+ start:478 stop:597 length:120 start_codon:yes stop_codon:yes gene_type:complete
MDTKLAVRAHDGGDELRCAAAAGGMHRRAVEVCAPCLVR